jgi:hypothetical protein
VSEAANLLARSAATSGEIFRLDNSNQSFVQSTRELNSMSVGTGVWGVNSSHDVFVFTNA